jgi:hypothetical protein
MASTHRIRDNALIDALEKIPAIPHRGPVWRVVRAGRDVLTPSSAGGRWDDATFDVLYTSQLADGAVAEMEFHLARGQPVFPSRVQYRLYELAVQLDRGLYLADVAAVARLGVDTSRFGTLSYADRQQEYPRTQEIGETALFLGYDGLVVPRARWDCSNVVVFAERVPPDRMEVKREHGLLDFPAWRKTPFGF